MVGVADRLSPVATHLDRVVEVGEGQEVVEPTDVGAAVLVHGHHTPGGGEVERAPLGAGAVCRGEQLPGRAPDQVVRLGGQRLLRVIAGGLLQVRDQAAQRGGGHRGMLVDAGQIDRAVVGHRVEFRGRREPPVVGIGPRPGGIVPPESPEDLAVVEAGYRSADPGQTVPTTGGVVEGQPQEREPGRGEVDVRVDEGGCHEPAAQVGDVRVGVQRPSDVVTTDPHHHAVGDGNRGRIGHGCGVHGSAEEQFGRHGGQVCPARAR